MPIGRSQHLDWTEVQEFDDANHVLAELFRRVDDDLDDIASQALTSADIELGDELEALQDITGTGLVARTAAGTYATRTLTAGTGITITNGDGVSGDPTIEASGSGGFSAAQVATRVMVGV